MSFTQNYSMKKHTLDGFIFMGTNFRGLNKNDTFMGFKIRGHSVFFHNSYKKLPFREFWNSWIGPSTKNTKIGTPRNLSHPQYVMKLTNIKLLNLWLNRVHYTCILLSPLQCFSEKVQHCCCGFISTCICNIWTKCIYLHQILYTCYSWIKDKTFWFSRSQWAYMRLTAFNQTCNTCLQWRWFDSYLFWGQRSRSC